MRSTPIYRLLIIGVLPISSAVCSLGAFALSVQASLAHEKLGFLLASFLSATIFIWAVGGILLALVAYFLDLSTSTLQKLWIFRPILLGVLGTTTALNPVQAADVVAVQPVEQASPFFSNAPVDTSPFFDGNAPSAHQIDSQAIEIVTAKQTTKPSQEPSIFFRSAAPSEQESDTSQSPTHTVVRGDTLWGIAQDSVPPGSTPAQIMQRTQQIYELNSDQLDSIDSLIYAGQILRIP